MDAKCDVHENLTCSYGCILKLDEDLWEHNVSVHGWGKEDN